MTKVEINQRLSKMSSDSLLKKVAKGRMNKKEAIIAATILERRFPTPEKEISLRQKAA